MGQVDYPNYCMRRRMLVTVMRPEDVLRQEAVDELSKQKRVVTESDIAEYVAKRVAAGAVRSDQR